SQPLPGGNVLIASSNQGKVFEVTRAGRVVWLYVVRGAEGNLVAMRAAKYPPSMIEPLLDRPAAEPSSSPGAP
ncbi:MAG: hypothetical protein AAFX50_21920, partial [Acidobacteriota bacterium]